MVSFNISPKLLFVIVFLFLAISSDDYYIRANSVDSGAKLHKCCPLDYDLRRIFLNVTTEIADDDNDGKNGVDNFKCEPSSGSLLTTFQTQTVVIGLPKCEKFETVDVSDPSGECIDKLVRYDTVEATWHEALTGVRCAGVSDQTKRSSTGGLPNVSSLRKCCPRSRSYERNAHSCWNPLTPDNSSTLKHLMKLTVVAAERNEVSGFVYTSFGFPRCSEVEVLSDLLVPYKNVEILSSDSVSISGPDGRNTLLHFGSFCLDLVDDIFEYLTVKYCQDMTVGCAKGVGRENRVCVRKCCQSGEIFVERKTCVPSDKTPRVALHIVSDDGFGSEVSAVARPDFVHGSLCKAGMYYLNPEVNPNEKYLVTVEGNIYVPECNQIYDVNHYCLEHTEVPRLGLNGTYPFICFEEPERVIDTVKHVFVFMASILSSVFLLMTFLVYACLPSLHNLHGKTIMCHVVTLLLGYIVLSIIYLPISNYLVFCSVMGYLMLFAFLSAFCWMNVICYDIWITFGAVRSAFIRKSGSKRRFLFYRLYGWALPALWTSITGSMQYSSILNNTPHLKPDISETSCWFDEYGYSRQIFFVAPVSAIIICNTVLYISTVRYCSKVRSELSTMQNNSNDYAKRKFITDKNRLMMNTKLFIVMGINWAMEILSLVFQPKNRTFFYLSDFINASGGLLIFYIFIMKKKVLKDVKSRICGNGNPDQGQSYAMKTTLSASVLSDSLMSSRQSTFRTTD